jgi:hypothetical protein
MRSITYDDDTTYEVGAETVARGRKRRLKDRPCRMEAGIYLYESAAVAKLYYSCWPYVRRVIRCTYDPADVLGANRDMVCVTKVRTTAVVGTC